MKQVTTAVMLAVALLLGSGCATTGQGQTGAQKVQRSMPDPFEDFNRAAWDFNWTVLDKHILRPITLVYVDYTPQFARTGLYNAALNLEEPSYAVNNLLQGKLTHSFTSATRFVLNSTVGLLGTIDIAEMIGMPRKAEEFGEVLGVWGLRTGPFLMLPAYGPSDIRSGTGDIVDGAYPIFDNLNFYASAIRVGIKLLETRARLIQQEQQLESALDPYGFVKNAYIQNLNFKVYDGKVPQKPEDDEFDEELDAFLEEF